MEAVLSQIITLLLSGITQMASGIGTGLSSLVQNIFLTGAGTQADPFQLSVYGGMIIVFAAIAFAIGLSRLIVNWLQSLGN